MLYRGCSDMQACSMQALPTVVAVRVRIYPCSLLHWLLQPGCSAVA